MSLLRRAVMGATTEGRWDWISLGTSVDSRRAAFANSSSGVRGPGSMTYVLGDMVCYQRFFPSVTNTISYLEYHFCINFLST